MVHLVDTIPLRPLTAERPNVIARLEQLLQMAKDGEILSVAFITVEPNGNVGTGFETSLDLQHAHHMVAGTVYLQRRLEENAVDG